MKNRTKGQLEAEICEAIIRFEKEFMGRGPLETKAYIIEDRVPVRLRNVLSRAELKLAAVPEDKNGREIEILCLTTCQRSFIKSIDLPKPKVN